MDGWMDLFMLFIFLLTKNVYVPLWIIFEWVATCFQNNEEAPVQVLQLKSTFLIL